MSTQSSQISLDQFNKKFLKYDDKMEILTYKGSRFHIVTPYITIFSDKYGNSNIYDDKLTQIFGDIETLLGDRINNNILSKYTNKKNEEKVVIRLKPHQDLSTEETDDLRDTQNKKYRIMIAFSPLCKYKGGYGIFPKIVRVASKQQEKGRNEYVSYKFE